MSSQIPPLVCHTPPPIDFDLEDEEEVEEVEDDDDYAPDIPDDDDFGDFATVPVAMDHPLPPEVVIESREREEEITPPPHSSAATPTTETTARAEQTRNSDDGDSIPSLVLSPNRTPCNEQDADADDADVEDIDFQPFPSSTQQPEPPPEDCISLPSLHLDTELSKSEDDDNVPVPLQLSASGSAIDTEIDLPAEAAAAAAAERTTPVIQEGAGRFDDNTENDFTDFTTASNERSSVVLEIPTANDVSFELDDFAQLESTPSADSNFVSQQSRGDFATFDADFSKFDSFQASFPATGDGGEGSGLPKTTPTVDEGGKHLSIGEQGSASGRKPIDPLPDDDFDDFQEFATFESANHATETFPTGSSTSSNRELQQQQPVQAMKATAQAQDSVTLQQDTPGFEEDAEDDDEFGEFSDFKQSTTIPTNAAVTAVPAFSMERVHALLEAMFPTTASDAPTTTDTGQQSWSSIPENMLHSQLQDFDNTNAVSYQHSKSSSSKALVTALGIDSRNIMYGPKWNSSMPRFAANLSFNPLEPLKPSAVLLPKEANSNEKFAGGTTLSKHTASASYAAEALQPSVAGSSVPAAQFDWNSSGLVNPLEGVQEMLQKATPGQPTDGAKGEILDSKVAEDAGPPAADDIAVTNPSVAAYNSSSPGPSVMLALPLDGDDEDVRSLDFANTPGSSSAQYTGPSLSQAIVDQIPQQQQQQQQYPASQQQQPMSIPISTFHGSSNSSSSGSSSNSNSCPTSSSSVPVMRTIKLPETHIFTPSRGGTPVSRDITDRDIVVREYHDVEYSLESRAGSRKETELDEFNDFQSAVGVGHTPIVPAASGYSRPVIGRSPTEELEHHRQESQPSIESANGPSVDKRDDTFDEDDEFTDFQAAPTIPASILPPTVHPINKPVSSVQANRSNTSSPVMLLSPAILLPQQTGSNEGTREAQGQNVAQINWPEPGVDPDELARFEAAFAKPVTGPVQPHSNLTGAGSASNQNPQTTTSVSKVKSGQEEDEWTDFMSSKPVTARSMPTSASSATAVHSTSSAQVVSSAAQEEWTDFISSTPSAGTGSTSQGGRLSSSHNHFNYSRPSAAKPLNSWSQPQLPPPQFNSWNSNSLYYNPMSSLSMQSPQHPRPSPATTPNSHYAAGPPVNLPYQQQAPGAYPQLASVRYGNPPQQQQMAPAVNLLPELSFITPHSSSGVGGRLGPSGGPPSQHTKPAAAAAHSFLSNVISSNSFAKK